MINRKIILLLQLFLTLFPLITFYCKTYFDIIQINISLKFLNVLKIACNGSVYMILLHVTSGGPLLICMNASLGG